MLMLSRIARGRIGGTVYRGPGGTVLDGHLQEPCDLNYQTTHHQVPVFEIGFLSTLLIAFWKTL
jgi:hypothetical protein